MKCNIKNSFLVFLISIVGMSGCSFLEVDIPDTLVKDNYWQSKEQLDAAMMGVYTSLNENIVLFIKWGDLRSDLYTYGPKATASERQFCIQDIYTGNNLANWANVYKGINWANSFLKNARSTMKNDPSVTLEMVQQMEGEAYAIRALYHFYLLRTFRDIPISMEPYESDVQKPYSAVLPEQVVLDTIEKDLKRAYELAPKSFVNPNENFGRITLNAVRAIWADVKLWRKDYAGCVKLCEELEPQYDFKMLPSNQWFTIFSPGNAAESIFEYQYIDKGVSSPLWGLYNSGTDNWFMANMIGYNRNVLQIFPAEAENKLYGDTIRTMLATVFPMSEKLGEVYKYTGAKPYEMEFRSSDNRRNINFIFYRYREVLLIKAEALAMLGQYTQAVAAINKFRAASELTLADENIYGQGEVFMDNLLCERVVELAYEGKQWFSMVRIARNTGYTNLLIERIAKTQSEAMNIKIQTLRARLLDPESWFLPYFNTEVDKNPLLEQKEYYAGKN